MSGEEVAANIQQRTLAFNQLNDSLSQLKQQLARTDDPDEKEVINHKLSILQEELRKNEDIISNLKELQANSKSPPPPQPPPPLTPLGGKSSTMPRREPDGEENVNGGYIPGMRNTSATLPNRKYTFPEYAMEGGEVDSVRREIEQLRETNEQLEEAVNHLSEELRLRDQSNYYYQNLEGSPQLEGPYSSPGVTRQRVLQIADLEEQIQRLGQHMPASYQPDQFPLDQPIPIKPATLYQCTRCEQIFKTIVIFQAHVTGCLEKSLFQKNPYRERRSIRTSSRGVFPKSTESLASSTILSRESLDTTTGDSIEPVKMLPGGRESFNSRPSNRSRSTSALYKRRGAESPGGFVSDRPDSALGATAAEEKVTVTASNTRRPIVTGSASYGALSKLPSQPILSYSTSRNFDPPIREDKPPPIPPKEPRDDSFRDSRDISFKEPRDIRFIDTPEDPGAQRRLYAKQSSINSKQRYKPTPTNSLTNPPRGAANARSLSQPSLDSKSPSVASSLQRPGSSNEREPWTSNGSLPNRQAPPPPPSRGEESRAKVAEMEQSSRRSRLKNSMKSPLLSIRRRMKSLERNPKNKESKEVPKTGSDSPTLLKSAGEIYPAQNGVTPNGKNLPETHRPPVVRNHSGGRYNYQHKYSGNETRPLTGPNNPTRGTEV